MCTQVTDCTVPLLEQCVTAYSDILKESNSSDI